MSTKQGSLSGRTWGIVLIVIGLVFLLDELRIIDFGDLVGAVLALSG